MKTHDPYSHEEPIPPSIRAHASRVVGAACPPAGPMNCPTCAPQLQALEQQIRVIERKRRSGTRPRRRRAVAKVTVNDKGVTLASADCRQLAPHRGLIQLDHRWFFGDDGTIQNNSFVLRRARIIAEGTFGMQFSFQIVPEFGGAARPSSMPTSPGPLRRNSSSSSAASRRRSAWSSCNPTRGRSSTSVPLPRCSCRIATSGFWRRATCWTAS